jgi:hypothetical protein
MGKAKYIYFDDEILERLEKIDNMSKLINQCLKSYFDEQEFVGLSKKEIEKKLKLLDLEQEYNKKKKEIENAK